MTEHLNKRFKDVLIAMGDPDIDVDEVVFHSIRHTSAGVKLRLSKRRTDFPSTAVRSSTPSGNG